MNLQRFFPAQLSLSSSRLLAPLLRRLSRLQPLRVMLAVEIVGSQLVGAVAEARGRALTLRNFVAIERSNPGDELPDPVNLKEIMDRLEYPGGPVVLVTPLARSVQITMNRAKVDKLRHTQLCDALRWEVEPFTGITGLQALIGAERGRPVEQDELLILTEDEVEVDVNVSVIERNVHRAMKQVMRRAGLKLLRLYPPEVCFFVPLFLEQGEGVQAVFDIGADYANFTVVRGRQPKQITTYPLGREVLQELIEGTSGGDAEQSLHFLLRQVPGPLPLLLTGVGAASPRIVEYLDGLCDYGARPLELRRADQLGRAGRDGVNTMYSIAAGAALRELFGRSWREIGITDAVSPGQRLRQSAYLVPMGVAVVLVVSLLGHYGYMKNIKERYKKRTKELETQIKEKKQRFDEYDKMKAEQRELEKKIVVTKRQIEFLRGGSDDNLIHIERVLRALFTLPDQMQLESVEQDGDRFQIKGTTEDFAMVGAFAVALQRQPWCRVVDIKVLEQASGGHLQFKVVMVTSTPEAHSVADK